MTFFIKAARVEGSKTSRTSGAAPSFALPVRTVSGCSDPGCIPQDGSLPRDHPGRGDPEVQWTPKQGAPQPV